MTPKSNISGLKHNKDLCLVQTTSQFHVSWWGTLAMQCFRDPACFHLWLYYPWAFPLHLLNPITGQGRRQNVEDHVRGFQKPGFEVSYVIPTKLHWLEFNPMALPNNREEWEVQFQPCAQEEKEQGLDEHIALSLPITNLGYLGNSPAWINEIHSFIHSVIHFKHMQ